MVAQFFSFISKVIRVNPNAMAAHKARTKTKGIPLRIHTVHHLIGINTHTVKYHSKFIHKSNIYITLAIFYNFNCFCCFY